MATDTRPGEARTLGPMLSFGDNLDLPKWVRWLPRNQRDEDQWADDSFAVLNQGYMSRATHS